MPMFRVPDMHCDGCVRSVTGAVHELDDKAMVRADLQTRQVRAVLRDRDPLGMADMVLQEDTALLVKHDEAGVYTHLGDLHVLAVRVEAADGDLVGVVVQLFVIPDHGSVVIQERIPGHQLIAAVAIDQSLRRLSM